MYLSTDKIEYQLNDITYIWRGSHHELKKSEGNYDFVSQVSVTVVCGLFIEPNIAELQVSNCPSLASSFCQ